MLVNGTQVGWIYSTHPNNAVTSGPISNGMALGKVDDWGGGNQGPPVHIEVKNKTGYSCYTDNGHAASPSPRLL